MIGPIKQLYEKDGAEFKPINPCDCTNKDDNNDGGNNGGGNLPDSISAVASAYSSDTPEAEASVNPSTGVFTFKFGLPRGEQGPEGPQGPPGTGGGIGGNNPIFRTVLVFKTYIPTNEFPEPDTPVGGAWDVNNDIIQYPEGWSPINNVKKPVWMSTGEFVSTSPNNPKWSKPVMISGEDGIDGVDGVAIEFIYKLTTSSLVIPDKPQSVNETGYVPKDEGWSDSPNGISEEMQCEWVCTRKKADEGNWSSWDGPVIWAKWGVNGTDGDGIEYIYKVNKGEALNNPTPEDTTTDKYQSRGEFEGIEYVPTELGWTDEPTGVSIENTHEWVCVRKQKDGIWQPFSNPTLWARYGEKGDNGISIRTMYTKRNASAEAPPVTRDDIDPGSIWGLTIPNCDSTEVIWSITAYVTYDNKLATVGTVDNEGNTITVYGWQGPILISGIAGKDGTPVNYKTYVYKLSDSKPNKPISNDPKNPGNNWVDYPDTTGQWWQCIGNVDGVTEFVTEWGEVLPGNGQDGVAQDGKRVEFRFAVNSSQTIPPSINKNIRQPSGWFIEPPIKTEGQFMWMTVATINPDDTLDINWSEPICISGEQGPKGETGPAGPVGPMGPSGISGIPGKDIKARYCLGTKDEYNAEYNETIANDVDPSEYGWQSVLPVVTEEYQYIWCIQTSIVYTRIENDDNYVQNLESPWSQPFRLNGINGIDGKGVGVAGVDEYYLVSNLSSGITVESGNWIKNSIPPFDDINIYLWNYEIIRYDNGTQSPPTTPAIIGQKGKDGKGIASIVEKYLASESHTGVTIDTPGWQSEVPATTVDKPFLWNWERITYTDNTFDDFVVVIGSRGDNGNRGQVIYPAGIYSKTEAYTADDFKAPYVFDPSDNNYYVLNYKGTWIGTQQNNRTPSQDYAANKGKYWMLMSSYDAIFANVGVIANGLIGSAVFNEDYMFSQSGIDKNGNISTSYQNFCDYNYNDPYDINNTFKPNWCVNLRTGEQWIGAGKTYFNSDGSGYLKGDLVADVFTPLYFTEYKSSSFILPKVPENAGKNFSIPYMHDSRSIVSFEFIAEDPTDKIVYTKRDGTSDGGTGDFSIEPSMTSDDVGGIGYIDCYGVGNKWHLIERSIKLPTIKFVNKLPNSGTEGILYVLV